MTPLDKAFLDFFVFLSTAVSVVTLYYVMDIHKGVKELIIRTRPRQPKND